MVNTDDEATRVAGISRRERLGAQCCLLQPHPYAASLGKLTSIDHFDASVFEGQDQLPDRCHQRITLAALDLDQRVAADLRSPA